MTNGNITKEGEELVDTVDIDSGRKQSSFRKGIINILKFFLISILTIFFFIFMFIFIVYLVPSIQELGKGSKYVISNNDDLRKEKFYKKQIGTLEKDVQKLSKKVSTLTPEQPYIVISTTNNRFFLYQNKKLIREGFCSSGSYTLLMTEGSQKWIFKTPKGKFRILTKQRDPVWKKPDWAFVEEGLPIPSANDDSRFEYGVLGDYALSLGDGYMIHGTIYKRFLGMPVTHGCIRLNDDDLEVIYKTLDFGSKVYIY